MSEQTPDQPLVPRPPRPEGTSEEEWANNLSDPANYGGEAAERAREEAAGTGPQGEALFKFREILVQTNDMEWVDKTLEGLSQKMLWRDEETETSIALVRFQKGAGIPLRHSHASNQFMFCLQGKYTYIPTGITLTPGSLYWNPKGALHGPTIAEEESVMLEFYDGPHYPTQPEWYDDPEDAR